jgi:transposase
MCELLVGLPAVRILGVVDEPDGALWVHVETIGARPLCSRCGAAATVKDRDRVELVDLPAFGRRTRLVWRKRRWACPNRACPRGSWTAEEPTIAAPRLVLTDRAGRWVAEQVGRCGRTVDEIAVELGCDWHTVNDAVIAYGTALVDDDHDRIGEPTAVGLDETLFARLGPWRTQLWSTSIVNVRAGQLLDVVPGRDSQGPCAWFAARSEQWRARIEWATLDLSGPYRAVFDTMLPDATQVADPFHLVKLANAKLDEVRRRVQNDTLGHRGRKTDPLYRCRRLLTRADERLDDKGRTKLLGSSKPATRTAKSAWPGTPRKSSGRSTTTPTRCSPSSSLTGSATTSKTPPARPRSTRWVAPSGAGRRRSLPGTTPTPRTRRPKR